MVDIKSKIWRRFIMILVFGSILLFFMDILFNCGSTYIIWVWWRQKSRITICVCTLVPQLLAISGCQKFSQWISFFSIKSYKNDVNINMSYCLVADLILPGLSELTRKVGNWLNEMLFSRVGVHIKNSFFRKLGKR